MAGRIRSLKPEYLDEEAIVTLSDAARVLYMALWSLADDHGNARAVPKYLAVQTWQDARREASIPDLLDELARAGLAGTYATPVGQHVHLVAWTTRWQRIDHPGRPRYPLPPADVISGAYVNSLGPPRTTARDSRPSSDHRPRQVEALVDSRPSRTRAPSPISDHRSPTTDMDPGSQIPDLDLSPLAAASDLWIARDPGSSSCGISDEDHPDQNPEEIEPAPPTPRSAGIPATLPEIPELFFALPMAPPPPPPSSGRPAELLVPPRADTASEPAAIALAPRPSPPAARPCAPPKVLPERTGTGAPVWTPESVAWAEYVEKHGDPDAPAVDHEPERPGAKFLPRVGVDVMAPFDPPKRIVDPEAAIREVLQRVTRPINYLADTRTPGQLYGGMMATGRTLDDVADAIAGAVMNVPPELQDASPERPDLIDRLHRFVARCVQNQNMKPRAEKRAERGEDGARAAWVLGTFGEAWRAAKGEAYVQGNQDPDLAGEVVTFLRTQCARAELQPAPKKGKRLTSQEVAKMWLDHKVAGYLSDTYYDKPNHPFAKLARILKDEPARWGEPSPARSKWQGVDPEAVREALEPVVRKAPATPEEIAAQQASIARITEEHYARQGGGPGLTARVLEKSREEQLQALARLDEEDRAAHPERYTTLDVAAG